MPLWVRASIEPPSELNANILLYRRQYFLKCIPIAVLSLKRALSCGGYSFIAILILPSPQQMDLSSYAKCLDCNMYKM